MRPGRAIVAAACAVLLLAAIGCAPPRQPVPPAATPRSAPSDTPSASATPEPTSWRVDGAPETLASGLDAPWSVVPLAGGGALVSQRDDGAVIELTAAGEQRVAGVVPGVGSGGEAGLHGLAILQDEGTWLYAYLGAENDNRVIRMPLTGEPGALGLGAAEEIVTGIARGRTHNGGRIAFGPDRRLYIATGDAGSPDDAQDAASLNGKILRVTPDGRPAPGNPFGTAVWSLGHRNVQGLAWTADGEMWASEFGQNTWDELNRIEPGANYGWPLHEGVTGAEGFTDPVAVWSPADASPSGIAAVGLTVFVTGLRGERLWVVDTDAGVVAAEAVAVLTGEQGRLRDAVLAPDGALWVLTNNTDGRGSPRAEDDLLLRLPLTPTG
ncbi:sorbosone dehydrogenase family protein [Microbacterium sp. RU33B]|uniref:PQQ-dependent sugar dehydrogenase n=1 Tax=Microbacterium sp. RU33B TaxID=1907390 RepID=UPI00095DEEEB|nr:PQQ-dependent sugar dehydrogenase [Microbacterium sp. RU33B]SIT73929.1 Glucose/arabinose dehydrogenase, beta-propeller fold [Microbacterium sp. RU33B]